MRLLPLALALASISAPIAAQQTVRYHDLFVNGYVTVLDLGNGPRIVVAGMGAAGDFAGYWQGLSNPIVSLGFDQVWVYDGNACRAGHVYAIHNSQGWAEQGYRVDAPMAWGPLRPATLPSGSAWPQRGGNVTYSLSVCEEWPTSTSLGVDTCPGASPDGCTYGAPQFWAVVLDIRGPR